MNQLYRSYIADTQQITPPYLLNGRALTHSRRSPLHHPHRKCRALTAPPSSHPLGQGFSIPAPYSTAFINNK